RVTPSAQLNRSRYLLLVFSPESGYGDVLPALELGTEGANEQEDGAAPTDEAAAEAAAADSEAEAAGEAADAD
ncbi:MAG: rod shape-determining protein MreC, partial [Pseudomonadota bacterium]|nr:rod shape-determining protein MreC [Pseudomonadota bacterium]